MYASEADYYHEYYGSGMGLAIPAIGSAISTIGGLLTNSKDPGRLAANAKAYDDAQAGDPSATTYLKARSGRYGTIPIAPPWHGDPVSPLGGWATSKAKDDAFTKYNAVSSAYPTQTTSYGATVPVSAATPGGPIVAGLSTGPLLVAGVAAAAIYFLVKHR